MSQISTAELLTPLPLIVQTWLKRSGILNRERIDTVHLHQRGEMRIKPGGKWMQMDAEQYNKIEEPEFFWLANVKIAPFLYLKGQDKYEKGRGKMFIRFFLVPIVHATGFEIDQGALIRYLAEIVWFPTAALAEYIRWEEISPVSAKATMTYKGITGSGIFTFTPEGDWESFEATRYYQRKGRSTLEKWHVEADPSGFKEFQGFRIPAKSEVTWQLKEGAFTWFKVQITEAEYNKH